MKMSATAQGVQSDGHVRNGPIDVSAALVNLAEMRARSDNHSEQDERMDTEELVDADADESMPNHAQMDGDAEEGMGVDTEESTAGHLEQPLGGNNGSMHEEEQPSPPIQETNPPTPVFSPVIPLESVTTVDADAIQAPETPLVQASPPPQGLHLLGMEGASAVQCTLPMRY